MAKVSGVALRPFRGDEGRVNRGDRFGRGGKFPALEERRADALRKRGLFVPDVGGKAEPAPQNKMEPAPQNKDQQEAAETADERPSTGGRTGEAKQSSSSQEDQAPKKRRSKKRAAKDDS